MDIKIFIQGLGIEFHDFFLFFFKVISFEWSYSWGLADLPGFTSILYFFVNWFFLLYPLTIKLLEIGNHDYFLFVFMELSQPHNDMLSRGDMFFFVIVFKKIQIFNVSFVIFFPYNRYSFCASHYDNFFIKI